MIGEIEGIDPGTLFRGRKELHDAGVHCGHMRGIAEKGGRDPKTGRQIADQTLTRGNLSLYNHQREGNPIRVTRGHKAGPPHAPATGYRYDGLFRIENCWQETGTDGFLIWRYRLAKLPSSDQISTESTPVAPEGNATPPRSTVYTTRVVRNSSVGNYVKGLHDYTCQISGTRLNTPLGPYAEACHIRPVGKPHNGPDTIDNILCLSPNMHVLFDLGAIALTDDLRILGQDGDLVIKAGHEIDIDHIRYHREHIYKG